MIIIAYSLQLNYKIQSSVDMAFLGKKTVMNPELPI